MQSVNNTDYARDYKTVLNELKASLLQIAPFGQMESTQKELKVQIVTIWPDWFIGGTLTLFVPIEEAAIQEFRCPADAMHTTTLIMVLHFCCIDKLVRRLLSMSFQWLLVPKHVTN
ncbi:hypothetical protein P8452_47759 [Trifolium repens]|nr:hypothetical protein P8452_47759 [Trifolium repens]